MRTQCLSANTPLICRKEFWVCVLKGMPRSRLVSEICYLCKRHSYFHAGILGFIYKIQSDFHHRLLYFFKCPFLWRDQWKYQTFSDRFSYLHPNPLHLFAIPRESGTVLPLFRLLYNRATSPTYLFTKESITNLLKLPFLELYADYYSTVKEHKVTTLHKEEIGYFFLDLLLKHYKENKEVAFYAEKLHVSSKYLTEALTLVSGKSPKEWIIHYTLQEIYALLENPSISIQEIVQRTRFANLATLRRFFKRHTEHPCCNTETGLIQK